MAEPQPLFCCRCACDASHLVDHARQNSRTKRGGRTQVVSLDEAATMSPERADELLALDEALNELAKNDRRKSEVVELRYFGGLSIDETAEILKVTPTTSNMLSLRI